MAVTTLRVKVGDTWYTVAVGDLGQSPFEVTVDGETFLVEIEGSGEIEGPPTAPNRPPLSNRPRAGAPQPPPPEPAAHPVAFSGNILRSPMPGRVMSILVRPGDPVAEGDEVCVVEAMKMEQSIRSPRGGVVKTVHVQPMDSVNTDDPLVELE